MKTPMFLLGAALLFWGWQTGLLAVSVIMAVVFECSRLIKSRLDLSSQDFNRVVDLCTILFLGVFAYVYVTNRASGAVFVMLQRLPLVICPIVLAQVYSTSEKISVSSLFLFLRKGKTSEGSDYPSIDLTFPYFAFCILCASAANIRSLWFYASMFVLSAWALWSVRPSVSPFLWAGLLALAGLSGYAGQIGLNMLHKTVEDKTIGWLRDSLQSNTDPYRAATNIGNIGTLKLSDRIVLRVTSESGYDPPFHLREASYNTYLSPKWLASRSRFENISSELDQTTWWPASERSGRVESRPEDRKISVAEHLDSGKGMLKLPNGMYEISTLPIAKITQNQYGAVKVEEGPGFINYHVKYSPDNCFDSPPSEKDLAIPEKEKPHVARVIMALGLKGKTPSEIKASLVNYFQNEFKYSLTQQEKKRSITPLGDFLFHSRSGHCEYFATATALLLRESGIPSRYASGYTVQEFSGFENCFVVRERHAHAWVLVYDKGRWSDFDTTPSNWFIADKENSSVFEPVYDLMSFISYRFSRWRWSERKGGISKHVGWFAVPLIIFLVWRLYSRKRVVVQENAREKIDVAGTIPGADSGFYLIEKRLNDLGYIRESWEPLGFWIERLNGGHDMTLSTDTLGPILDVHYRYRFDPNGIGPDEMVAFNSDVKIWLDQAGAVTTEAGSGGIGDK